MPINIPWKLIESAIELCAAASTDRGLPSTFRVAHAEQLLRVIDFIEELPSLPGVRRERRRLVVSRIYIRSKRDDRHISRKGKGISLNRALLVRDHWFTVVCRKYRRWCTIVTAHSRPHTATSPVLFRPAPSAPGIFPLSSRPTFPLRTRPSLIYVPVPCLSRRIHTSWRMSGFLPRWPSRSVSCHACTRPLTPTQQPRNEFLFSFRSTFTFSFFLFCDHTDFICCLLCRSLKYVGRLPAAK